MEQPDRLDLIEKYKYLPAYMWNKFKKRFFVIRSDRELYIHEGKVALWYATLHWRGDGGAGFMTYACTCLWNHFTDLWRQNKLVPIRGRGTPRNVALSIKPPSDDGLAELTNRRGEERVMGVRVAGEDEARVDLEDLIAKRLNQTEAKVVRMYLEGHKLREIAAEIGYSHQWANDTLKKCARRLLDMEL